MSSERPNLLLAISSFREIYNDIGKTVPAVGKAIGGKVNYNINSLTPAQGAFQNACAIRMSYVLNKTGIKIPYMAGKTVSGEKGNWYLYKVRDLIDFLYKTLGEPNVTIENPTISKFKEYKGILVFDVDQWTDATGHATIWSGAHCSDKCYFPISKKAYLWTLKD
ncbi:MAG: hypothetical protein ACJAW8_002047 [Oleispira sp.]|jgi:hypothetical protein